MSLPKSRRQCTFKFQRVLSAFPVERLPELLPEELLREVLGKHKCLFGGVFHSAIVTWAFLCQVMRDGKDATCQAAVARISNFLIQIGRNAPHANTGDYCYARAKLKPSMPNIQPKSQAWDSRSLVWWLYSIWELVAYWMLRSGRIKGKTLVRLLCFAISCRVSRLGMSLLPTGTSVVTG